MQRVLRSSCKKQRGHTQQPLFKAPQPHHQGVCGFKNLSVLTRRRSATPQDFVFSSLLPPKKKCDSPVSNGDISFPNYSGSSWLHNTWGCGEKGGGREEPDCKVRTTHSLPHTGMLLLNFRTTSFGTRWQIPSEENNKTSRFQEKYLHAPVMQFSLSQEGLGE